MSATVDYGIDLGTTNSSVACCRNGEVRVFQSVDLMSVTPSVVYLSKSGRLMVGRKAYDTWAADPLNTQAEFKRWMGYSDKLKFPASGKTFSAEDLSAEVLKSVRGDVERATGETIDAAVITVPAAFGSLQCDATHRAARMAGFVQSPLLQEPIAAAIAYGAAPSSGNQRWMVFDLGGGTLDIAIVSTRNGRLAVLEHQGNNRLGGKDIDRLIAEEMLLPPLAAAFDLPDRAKEGAAFERLMRALVRQAEHAKIALSTAPTAVVDLMDLGDDKGGKPIELTLNLARTDMEAKVRPVLDQCIQLVGRAMQGARLSKADLDRVILVGGPTQMPVVRDALTSALGVKLDYSIDPMTVVSQGAALFASTIERTTPATSAPATCPSTESPAPAISPTPVDAVPVQLAYERASGTTQSPLAGILSPDGGVYQVKVDADGGGYWSSGWVNVEAGAFQLDVTLSDRKPVTEFTIIGRDAGGAVKTLTPSKFAITRMLPMAAPPLPHTIAIELSTLHGVSQFDPVFKRHSPLPAEVKKTYRASATLRPSDVEGVLPIKFWEIDVSADSQERWWAGCVNIEASQVRRPILEGTEIELTVRIDASRKMSVEAFVPSLQQSFREGVYVPDPPSAKGQLQQQLALCFDRLDHLRTQIYEAGRPELAEPLDILQFKVESIHEQVTEEEKRGVNDPDAALRPTDALRKIRVQLSQIEEQLEAGGESKLVRETREEMAHAERIVGLFGSDADRSQMAELAAQIERLIESDDHRGIKWARERARNIYGLILERQPWFLQAIFRWLREPERRFLNREQAKMWMAKAEMAEKAEDWTKLRTALGKLFELQPPDQVELARQQAAQSGLRAM